MGATKDRIYYYHNDHLGTPLAMTNESGNVVWKASYTPFGEAVVVQSSVTNNFRFPGQYYDQESGLHYNYHRYYDPGTGRYLRADPSHSIQPQGNGIPYLLPYLFTIPQELNLYPYVLNNPIKSTDKLGLYCDKDCMRKCYNELVSQELADACKHCNDLIGGADFGNQLCIIAPYFDPACRRCCDEGLAIRSVCRERCCQECKTSTTTATTIP